MESVVLRFCWCPSSLQVSFFKIHLSNKTLKFVSLCFAESNFDVFLFFSWCLNGDSLWQILLCSFKQFHIYCCFAAALRYVRALFNNGIKRLYFYAKIYYLFNAPKANNLFWTELIFSLSLSLSLLNHKQSENCKD